MSKELKLDLFNIYDVVVFEDETGIVQDCVCAILKDSVEPEIAGVVQCNIYSISIYNDGYKVWERDGKDLPYYATNKKIIHLYTLKNDNRYYEIYPTDDYRVDNANPSEALKYLEEWYGFLIADNDTIYSNGNENEIEYNRRKETIYKQYNTIKQALLKIPESKHYLKWEDLEFKNKQCIEYKVLLNGVEYYMFVCDEDEEKYDSLSKHVVLSRVKVVDEMGKPVKGHEFFDYIEADKQFFNDLHLERVEDNE